MANVMFRQFFCGMSSDVPAFKVHVLTSDFKFLIGVNEYSRDIVTQILLTLDFHCLTNFAKNINLS